MEVTEESVLWFRARRWHLAGGGAPDAATAARALVGAQSQQLSASLLGLSQRMAARPTAAELEHELFEARSLVRTWGQRDTLFLYDPSAHWRAVVAARGEWSPGARRGVNPTAAMLAKVRTRVRKAERPLTRSDIFDLVPASLVEEADGHMAAAGMPRKPDDALRFAAGRLLWKLAQEGEISSGRKAGPEQAYPARADWFPGLDWPRKRLSPREGALGLVRDYLASYGPATAADVAYFFGAKVSLAREWLVDLEAAGELAPVRCGDREGLVVRKADRRALKEEPPRQAKDWPVRLLPLWDAVLMAHADKRWALPDPTEEKLVWRKAAVVAATVVHRGRLVGTWSQKKTRKRLRIEVQPLGAWRKSKHLAGVKREAAAVAAHLGLESSEVAVAG